MTEFFYTKQDIMNQTVLAKEFMDLIYTIYFSYDILNKIDIFSDLNMAGIFFDKGKKKGN